MPTARWAREWRAGRSSGAGPGIASRPDPVAGINGDTVRAPAADAGRRQARAARHLAGVPGRRLKPAAQSAKSPGTPPCDDDLDAAAAHPGQDGGRQPALPAGQQPARGALATGHGGHAARRPGKRHGLPPARAVPALLTSTRRPCQTLDSTTPLVVTASRGLVLPNHAVPAPGRVNHPVRDHAPAPGAWRSAPRRPRAGAARDAPAS